MAVESHDFPLAPRDRAWDQAAAEKRVREWSNTGDDPNAKYASAFFWHADGDDPDKDGLPDHFGDYKLQYADVVDGKLQAIPRAIFAVAARLDQTDIPAADKDKVKAAVNGYYAKMRKAFDDDSIKSPFERADPSENTVQRFVHEGRHEFTVEVRAANIDEHARTADLAFSSEHPVERMFGKEILDHGPGSIRMDRINGGAPLLLNHDTDRQIGVVERAFVGDDRRGRATVRFSRSALGREIFQDVQDGIRRLVSVGYKVHAEPRQEGEGSYRFTDWEPLELSIVPVPADASVGIGRSEGFLPTTHSRSVSMTETAKPVEGAAANVEVDVDKVRSEARKAESERVRSIYAIAEKHGARFADLKEKADEYVRDGRNLDEFRNVVLERFEDVGDIKLAKPEDLEVGLGAKERKDFSLTRLINYMADSRQGTQPKVGGFEFEVAQEATEKARKLGRNVQGILIPEEVLSGKREVTVGVANSGGELVATNLLAQDFVELLRNATPVMGLGPTVLPGLVGNVAIPRQSGGATTYWVAESVAPTESDQTFDQVTLSPKTLAANTKYSRKTLLQTTPAIEGLVREDLARVMGIELDRAAISGSGASNQPTGILNTTGIGSVVAAADAGNGGALAWADVIAFITKLAEANALRGNLAYLSNAQVSSALRTTPKVSGYPMFIQENVNELAGYNFAQSQNIPANGTKGTGTALSSMVFGNFRDLLIGEWGGLDMIVDPYSYSTQGGVQITIFRDVDLNVRHPVSFAAATDIIA